MANDKIEKGDIVKCIKNTENTPDCDKYVGLIALVEDIFSDDANTTRYMLEGCDAAFLRGELRKIDPDISELVEILNGKQESVLI